MPIVVNLKVMLAKRKLKLYELSELIGISVANLSILNSDKSKAVRLSTLDAICRVLECQPGDILEWADKETYRKLFRK
jgi:putative transcriptional regulator